MSAKEMFAMNGYTLKFDNDGCLLYYRYDYRGDREVCFYKTDKFYQVRQVYPVTTIIPIFIDLHKAIQQQIIELGWEVKE